MSGGAEVVILSHTATPDPNACLSWSKGLNTEEGSWEGKGIAIATADRSRRGWPAHVAIIPTIKIFFKK